MLFPFTRSCGITLAEAERAVMDAPPEQLRALFLSALDENDVIESANAHHAVSMEAFIGQIMQNGALSAAGKCRIAQIFVDYKASFQQALPVMKRLTALIDAEAPAIKPLLNQWNQRMRPMAAEDSPLIRKHCGNVPMLEQWPYEGEIRPGLTMFTSFVVSLFGGDGLGALLPGRERGLIAPGLCFLEMQELLYNTGAYSRAEMLAVLKMLGDKSKSSSASGGFRPSSSAP